MSPLKKLVEVLQTQHNIRFKELEIGDPLDPQALEMIESGFEIRLPEEVKHLFDEHNGLRFVWIAEQPEDGPPISDSSMPYGRFWLPDIDTMFLGPTGGEWRGYLWDEDTPEGELEERQSLIPFDFFDNNKTECICMKKKNGTLDTSTLWYFSSEEKIRSFPCSLTQYIELTIKTRAFCYWQQAAMTRAGTHMTYFKKYFNRIFPGQVPPVFNLRKGY